MTMIILLAIVAGLGYRCTTAEDRERLLAAAVARLRRAKLVNDRHHAMGDPFRAALTERVPRVIVTPVLVAINVLVFVLMLFGSGAMNDPETLISWGASVGTRTTNGEWWRLVTATFVHSGLFGLIVNMACVFQVGMILERLVGRIAVAGVYVAAGIFAGLAAISSYPIAVSHGASAAVYGLYGMLIGTFAWSLFPRSTVTMPIVVAKRLVPLAALFAFYNLLDGSLPVGGEFVGAIIGLAGAAGLAKGVDESTVPPHRAVPALVGTLVVAFACAAPLRGIADVRPEIAHVVDVEDRTAHAYQTASERFRTGKLSADALAQVIDASIVPELQAVDSRLKALTRVPPEYQGLLADAEEYVRLRRESWRLRSDGLRRSATPTARRVTKKEEESAASWRLRTESQYRGKVLTLAKAEGAERASLEMLDRIRPVNVTAEVTVKPEATSSRP